VLTKLHAVGLRGAARLMPAEHKKEEKTTKTRDKEMKKNLPLL